MSSLSLDLYYKLFVSRIAEEYVIKFYHEDEMKTPMHMSMGQEFIPAAACQALGDRAQIFTSYRSHAPYICRTDDVEGFFGEMYGKISGPMRGKGGSMHLSNPDLGHICASAIVSSMIPVVAGAAWANKMKKTGKIATVFFGDGAVDEGCFWETMNISALMQVPALFICEDNGLAVHTPKDQRQGYKNLPEIIRHFDVHVIESDSSDVEEVHALFKEAEKVIDETGKPVFMHLKCFRYLEHVGVYEDFKAGYREKEQEWYDRDALMIQRQRLLDQGVPEDEIVQLEKEAEERVEKALMAAKAEKFPEDEELYDGVFYG